MLKLKIIVICCLVTGTLCGCSGGGCNSKKSSKSSGCGSSGCGSSNSGSSSGGCSIGGCGSSGSSSSGCSSRGCGSSSGISSSGISSSCGSGSCSGISDGFTDLDYEAIPMPPEVTQIGIMDAAYYDCSSKSLYFVDLFGSNLFRYSEEYNRIFYCSIPNYPTPSFLIPARNQPNMYVMGVNQSVYTVQWDGISPNGCQVVSTLVSAEQGTNHHTNAAVAGKRGALYFGFFSPPLCGGAEENGFFRYTKKGGLERLPGSYKTSNTLAYDNKRNILYHSDGCTHIVRATKVNPKTGKLSAPKPVLTNFDIPDSVAIVGMSVDSEGMLWIGTYGGGVMYRCNPFTGQILNKYPMPLLYMGGNAFGGCNYDKFYLLTAQLHAKLSDGSVITIDKTPPGGQLLVFNGLGKGQGPSRKPCIGC